MGSRVGGSFTALTVKENVLLAEPPLPSSTVTVIAAVPKLFAAGVTVTVRLLPLPPKTMLVFGTSAGLDETPLRTKLAAGVSTSLIVNASAGVDVSSLML